MKKTLSVFLSILLLLSMLPAAMAEDLLCADEPITYTAAVVVGSGNGNPNESIWFKEMAEATNVSFDFTVIPEEVQKEQTQLMLLGDLPDVFMTLLLDQSTANQLGMEGLLLPLDEAIAEHAPHITQLFEENPLVRAQVTAEDGHIYALPKVDAVASRYQTVATEMFINTEYLAKVGKEMPTTTEELYDVLVAFAQNDLDGDGDATNEIPLGFHYQTYDFGCMLMGAFGAVNSTQKGLYFDYDAELGQNFSPMANSEGYKQWLGYMNRLYTEKLIDQDVFMQDNPTYMSKAAARTYGAFVGWGGWNEVTLGNLSDGSDEYTGVYQVVPVLAGPDGQKNTRTYFNGGLYPASMCVTEACEDIVPLIKWADKLYDQEMDWNIQTLYGPVGYNLEVKEDGTFSFIPTPEGMAYTNFRWTHSFNNIPLWTGAVTATKLPLNANQTFKSKIDAEKGYIDAAAKNKAVPVLTFTEDEQAELSIIETDVDSYIKQYRAQAISGEVDLEASWGDYVASLNRLGIEQMAEIYNAAYVRLMELLN